MSYKIHTLTTDTPGDIKALTEKVLPAGADLLIVEDSAAGYAKKKVQIGNLPTGGGGTLVQRDWSGGSAITTANVLAGGPAVSDDVAGWFNLGLVHRLKLVANSDTRLLTFRLYGDAAHTILLYEVIAVDAWTSPFEDRIPFHIRDEDATSTLHYVVLNAGVNDSTVTVTLQGIGG